MAEKVDFPRVLNKKNMRAGDSGISIMRPGPFGNMFQIGRDGNRDEVCDKYEDYVENNPELKTRIKSELKGYNVICCCYPLRCHGITVVRIANEPEEGDEFTNPV